MTEHLPSGTPVRVVIEGTVEIDQEGTDLYIRGGEPADRLTLIRRNHIASVETLTPECNYGQHHRDGTGRAVWELTHMDPLPCGCAPRTVPLLMCDGCLKVRMSRDTVSCSTCMAVRGTVEAVRSIARITL